MDRGRKRGTEKEIQMAIKHVRKKKPNLTVREMQVQAQGVGETPKAWQALCGQPEEDSVLTQAAREAPASASLQSLPNVQILKPLPYLWFCFLQFWLPMVNLGQRILHRKFQK